MKLLSRGGSLWLSWVHIRRTVATPFSVNVAKHVGVDGQAEGGQVVDVFAGDEPDELADGMFGVEAGHMGEGAGLDLLVCRELSDIVEHSAFGIGEEWAVAVPIKGVELGFVDRCLDREGAADIHAEEAFRRATCSRIRKTISRGNRSFLSS